VNTGLDSKPSPWLRILRFAPTRVALLYLALTYLYLSGFFFRTSFTNGPLQALAATVMAGAMMLIVYAGLVVYIERRTVSELALPPLARELGLGLLLGFGLYSVCVLILMGLGNYRIVGLHEWHILLTGMATALATGVFEELLFRGGVFRLAEEWFGSWAALVISSLVFGFVHLNNEEATLQGVVSISIWAGILLAATYLLTRRLWLGIGLHAAWNYTQGTVYSGIVSGNAPPEGFIRSALQGSEWLTGGSFGVEASVVAVAVCSTVGVLMLVKAVRRGHIMPPPWKRKG
jgi:membrane protease YdiL (CAAX protease family)